MSSETRTVFTEAELDAAAEAMVSAALHDCPDRIHDFLSEAQLDGLRADLSEAIKTSFLFDLMNNLAEVP